MNEYTPIGIQIHNSVTEWIHPAWNRKRAKSEIVPLRVIYPMLNTWPKCVLNSSQAKQPVAELCSPRSWDLLPIVVRLLVPIMVYIILFIAISSPKIELKKKKGKKKSGGARCLCLNCNGLSNEASGWQRLPWPVYLEQKSFEVITVFNNQVTVW